eukprot:GILK01005020.1.p1 GENE.GILK01005020.1~~GILK01005020.1.p1  ORF type:complete len:474 (+),score=67.66 GILK01005020.1:84-1505(+)
MGNKTSDLQSNTAPTHEAHAHDDHGTSHDGASDDAFEGLFTPLDQECLRMCCLELNSSPDPRGALMTSLALPGSCFAEKLCERFITTSPATQKELSTFVGATTKDHSSRKLMLLCGLYADQQGVLQHQSVELLLHDCFQMAAISTLNEPPHDPLNGSVFIPSLQQCSSKEDNFTIEDVRHWLKKYLTDIPSCLTNYINTKLMRPYVMTALQHLKGPDFDPADLDTTTVNVKLLHPPPLLLPALSDRSYILKQADLYALAMVEPKLQTSWTRLYSSSSDGLSFQRLSSAVVGYKGCTLLVIRDSNRHIFGVFAAESWQDTGFGGSSASFLFAVSPNYQILRSLPSVSNNHFTYLNVKGLGGKPAGIGMGGDMRQRRIWIDKQFDTVVTRASDSTFEPGIIGSSSDSPTGLVSVEMWGCGGMDALQKQKEFQNYQNKLLEGMRKVDKKAFANNEFDREFLLGGTFANGVERREDR